MQIVGRRYDTEQPVAIEVVDGRIAAIDDLSDDGAQLPWLAPGFIDLQVNGYGGREFSSPTLTVDDVAAVTKQMAAFGVSGYLPTLTTAGEETLAHAMRTIAVACEHHRTVAARVLGIHLEGPYISPLAGPRGAHPAAHCRPPDIEEFKRLQGASGGRIRLITLSPEYTESPAFIRQVAATRVVVAIGHTAATRDQIRAAIDAGATLSTHLGNGAHRELPRHPNYIWDQLAEDRLSASLIVDGQHLPPEVVQSFVRAKTPERCILVSDLAGLAGMPPGRYASGLSETEILSDGRLVVASQRTFLAGASRPIGAGIANVMRFAGIDLESAVRMATSQPAELIGVKPGRFVVGTKADLISFELAADGLRLLPT